MGPSQSAWQDVKFPQYPLLSKKMRCDVVVIGGGITGITAAYLLKQAGKKVCLLERDRLAHGDTGCTTAHLTYVTDLRLSEMVKTFGKDAARLVWRGGAAAINTIEGVAGREGIDCEFRRIPGFLHAPLTENKDESRQLKSEAELAAELGIAASFVNSVPKIGKPGICFANVAKFHPLKYLAGLAKVINGNGTSIFERSEVTEFTEKPFGVKANGKQVECDYIVIATHVPLMGKTGLVNATLLQTKLAPYSTLAIGAKLPHGEFPEASFWDTSDPYYYLRIDSHKQYDYAIFGGKDYKTGQKADPEQRFAALARLLVRLAPKAKVDLHWSGQVIETNDGLPYIGETAEKQFAATGFAGNGMTFGTLAAMMACDAALAKENPWQDLFSVNRKKIRGGTWNYVTENIDYPYYLVRDWLTGAEASSPADVQLGDGKVLTVKGQRVACSRDESGKTHCVSAVCTHMGCIVHWNPAEQTWDCPCHGSRFQPTGEVIGGPAEAPLETVKVPEKKASARTGTAPRRRSAAAKSNR